MKVYFTASLTGKNKYIKNYEIIMATIDKLGYKLLSKNVLARKPEDILNETPDEAYSYYKKMVNWIKEADIVVAEVSYPSLGIGYEVALSLEEGKQVIVLYTGEREPYLLESSQNDRLQIMEYKLENLSQTIESSLNIARQQLDLRFTLLLPPHIVQFLNNLAEKEKIPRSVFIRNLIEGEMKKRK